MSAASASVLRKKGQPRRLRNSTRDESKNGRSSIIIASGDGQSEQRKSRGRGRGGGSKEKPEPDAAQQAQTPQQAQTVPQKASSVQVSVKPPQAAGGSEASSSKLEKSTDVGVSSTDQSFVQDEHPSDLEAREDMPEQSSREADAKVQQVVQNTSNEKPKGDPGTATSSSSNASVSQQRAVPNNLKIETSVAAGMERSVKDAKCSQETVAPPEPGVKFIPSSRIPWSQRNCRLAVRC